MYWIKNHVSRIALIASFAIAHLLFIDLHAANPPSEEASSELIAKNGGKGGGHGGGGKGHGGGGHKGSWKHGGHGSRHWGGPSYYYYRSYPRYYSPGYRYYKDYDDDDDYYRYRSPGGIRFYWR